MRVAVIGAGGRMGQALIEALATHPTAHLAAAVVRPGSDWVGVEVPGTDVSCRDDISHALDDVDVAIDFATTENLQARANACGATGTSWLLGTTGLTPSQEATVVSAARLTPVLFSANTSVAVNGVFDALTQLAAVLGPEYDVDIQDIHHRNKIDAPSGTALELGRAVARGWNQTLEAVRVVSDSTSKSPPERPRPGIAFSAVRAGAHPGEHRVLFSGEDDCVEVVHRVKERGVFARGALRAACWLAEQDVGLYDMADFLASLSADSKDDSTS